MIWDLGVYGLVVLLVGIVAIVPRSAWFRAAGFACLVVALVAMIALSLGHVRPQLPWVPPVNGKVLAYVPVEPDHIALWVLPVGSMEPMAVSIPWSREQARKLQDLAKMGREGGGQLTMVVKGRHLKGELSKAKEAGSKGKGEAAKPGSKDKGRERGPRVQNGLDWLKPYAGVDFELTPPQDRPDKEEMDK